MEDRSLAYTPTWSVIAVLTAMILLGFLIHGSILRLKEWLGRTRRKPLMAALEAIMEELMVFGMLSLLMGHWTGWFSKICVKEVTVTNQFYTCVEETYLRNLDGGNQSFFQHIEKHHSCPEGLKPFVSPKSLEQLHRFILVLGVIHTFYSLFSVSLAMLKICFIRQFWTTVENLDYMALRLGFIKNHRLPLSYNFHKYLLRSIDNEFRVIVGISAPLWGYAIICVIFNAHGTKAYFWLSFIPAALILIVGARLQHIVLQLNFEVWNENHWKENQLKPYQELIWFKKPEVLLGLIQIISFQNALEMATLLWSLWEIKASSCFMQNQVFIIVRLSFGILFQTWCSYYTFPFFVIITQMGYKMKRALFTESITKSVHEWRKRAKFTALKHKVDRSLITSSSNFSLDTIENGMNEILEEEVLANSFHDEKLTSLVESLSELDDADEQPQSDKHPHIS